MQNISVGSSDAFKSKDDTHWQIADVDGDGDNDIAFIPNGNNQAVSNVESIFKDGKFEAPTGGFNIFDATSIFKRF